MTKIYSVQSAYKALTHHTQSASQHIPTSIWKANAPLKVLTFAWRLFQDRIATKDALLKRDISVNNGGDLLCVFCKESPESTNHLFSSCTFSYSV
ncbi:hypothetical protein Lal_00017533 [Lupinus albus]|nr:hypothetical protein Lal_00017533 [Lupinus albus]